MSCDYRVVTRYHELLSFKFSHKSIKFSGSGNITFFICHVTSHDNVIERTFDFVFLAPYHKPPYPLRLGGRRSRGNGDITLFI